MFEEEHAPFFFGRAAQVQRLTEMLRQGRFLAVIGQSGVGKSSLVRAGLLPALRAGGDRWRVLLLRPGVLPAATLTAQLIALHPRVRPTVDRLGADQRLLNDAAVVALGDEPPGTRLLVVVDQLEEVFTLCANLAERRTFVQNLLYAATYPNSPVVVVVAMRADFYPRLVEFPAFAQLAQSHQLLVPPMGDDELREVIIEPAYKVGLSIEQGLTDTILADVVREPGTLPLLELALLETWQHRSGTMLTLEGYRATGGVSQALGVRAEDVYGALSDAGREQARHVFLRLIQPGEGTDDTRRRVAISEITTSDDDAAAKVIQEFVAAFLLTTGADDGIDGRWVEISHEAVITGWARCARWVDEDRAGLLVHRRLTLAAQEWKRRGRSLDVLYRGVPLAEAQAWRTRALGRLNWLESDFLDAGSAREQALRRSRRRKYAAVITALVTALVIIAVIAVVAVVQRNAATSRQLAAEATKALDVDPALSLTLALRAEDSAATAQADEALRQATATSHGRSSIASTGGPMYGVRMLPDGRHAITGSENGSVDLWNLPSHVLERQLARHEGRVYAVRLSPDGQTVASSGLDRIVRVTQVATGQSRVVLSAKALAVRIEFSPDGRSIAAPLGDGTVHLVDVAAGRDISVLRVGAGAVYSASFSADGSLLATAGADGVVQIWRLADGARLRAFRVDGPLYTVAFSPSALQVAAGGADGTARVWDASTGAVLLELPVRGGEVVNLRYSRNGQHLAAGGLDGSVVVWDTAGLVTAVLSGHGGRVQDLDFDRTGTTVITAGADGSLRTWQADEDVHVRTSVTTAAFSRDGTRIASGGPDGHLRVFRGNDLATVLDIADHPARSEALFATDGTRIISYGREGTINLRDADGRLLTSFDPGVGAVRTVATDPADRRLVVGGDNGRLVVVDYGGRALETLTTAGSPVRSARFSPDGHSVLVGRLDGDLTLWGSDRHPFDDQAGRLPGRLRRGLQPGRLADRHRGVQRRRRGLERAR